MVQFLKRTQYWILGMVALCVLLASCTSKPTLGVVATGDSGVGAGANGERYETRQVKVPDAVLHLLRDAESLIDQGQLEQAKNKLARAQRMAPSYSRSYLLWSLLYNKEGNIKRAEQMLNRASSLATSQQEKQAVIEMMEEINSWP